MQHRGCKWGLWISTIVILVLFTAQGWTGNWATFYLLWPGSNVSDMFLQVTANLAVYHMKMGYAIGAVSILIIIFDFLAKSNIYVKVFSILGLIITAVAALGGYLFVSSSFEDRLSLGQMADAFIGAFIAYFLMLFFMNKVPRFPWSRAKSS
jgi:hypothetical protein